MPSSDSTSITLIVGAASGDPGDQETFARVYTPVIRAYLCARWRGRPQFADLEDAVQEVFVDCFRAEGALARMDLTRPERFRSYLHGITRNVALRIEARTSGRRGIAPALDLDLGLREAPSSDRPSRIFDRVWAQAILREALSRLIEVARLKGERAVRRVELLQLRVEEGRPIREIARRWNVDAARLHKEYARIRAEFKEALKATLNDHCCGAGGVTEEDMLELLELLDSASR